MAKQTARVWIVYIIETRSGKLYTGITTDLARRFQEHTTPGKGARFFRGSPPEHVVYTENQPNRSKATLREMEIKKMTRQKKLRLIASGTGP